ncbi:MAG: hypothetical protein BGP06_03600 [Rhizobiales bacterium 65-9]|nr:MAG: hypothetical protein BGP06_03600 [Rhizobiales bacterium 65-9]
MSDDIAWLGIADGGRRLADGTLTSTDWTEALLARIERLDKVFCSTLTLLSDHALRAAEAADRERAAGKARGPLHGVPIGIKDVIELAGAPVSANSAVLTGRISTHSAELVTRLEKAGAVILAKHGQYEFSYGGPSFDLPWPPARNPWNPERTTGGSSSGSGAAVAAGLCAAAVGTDAGGSIRQPSAYCGLSGLKPSAGLVPREGIVPLSFSLGEAGPMARSAEDCAYLLDAMTGLSTVQQLGGNIEGLRIGVLQDVFNGHVFADPAVVSALRQAVQALTEAGARVVEVKPPDVYDLDACGRVILLAEAYANHEPQLKADPMKYGRIGRHRFLLGAFLSAADYVQAQRQMAIWGAEMNRVFDDVDVLVTAGEVTGAPTFGKASASFGFTGQPSLRMPFTVAGCPALVAPCGFDSDGMPLSMQIAARRGNDATVLNVGARFQKDTNWHRCKPPIGGL